MASTSKSAFFTRGGSNTGVRVPIRLPNGDESDEWLNVLGIDSDQWREAYAEAKRAAITIATLGKDENGKEAPEARDVRRKALREEELKLDASLVSGWSFQEECTRETVIELLREAPYLVQIIDNVSSDRARFLGVKSSNSPSTQNGVSNSTSAQMVANKP